MQNDYEIFESYLKASKPIYEVYKQSLNEGNQHGSYSVNGIVKAYHRFDSMGEKEFRKRYKGSHTDAVKLFMDQDDFQIEKYGTYLALAFYCYVENDNAIRYPAKLFWFGGDFLVIVDN